MSKITGKILDIIKVKDENTHEKINDTL